MSVEQFNCKGCGMMDVCERASLSRYGFGEICSDCSKREAVEGNFIMRILDANGYYGMVKKV